MQKTNKKRSAGFYPFAVIALISGSALFSYQLVFFIRDFFHGLFPDTSIVKTMYPVAIAKTEKRIIYKFQKNRPAQWVGLNEIPKKAVAAVLISEDSEFYQHHGYSAPAIRAAWEYNRKPGTKVKRGGSTITQQLVKNLFLSREKTLARKFRELLLAVDLERKVSKARILETYLNIVEWGPGIYGIEAASQAYFKKTAANLTARDAAILAFMLPNPAKYRYSLLRPEGLSAFANRRVDTILERLWRAGHLSDGEWAEASLIKRHMLEDENNADENPNENSGENSDENASVENEDALPSEL